MVAIARMKMKNLRGSQMLLSKYGKTTKHGNCESKKVDYFKLFILNTIFGNYNISVRKPLIFTNLNN